MRHPISFSLILAFGWGVPSSVYSSEIKEFFELPPQGLRLRILKARLGAVEMTLYRIERLRTDVTYFLYQAFRALLFPLLLIGTSLLLNAACLLSMQAKTQEHVFNWKTITSVSLAVSYFGVYVGLSVLSLLHKTVYFEQYVPKLLATSESLRRRLELLGGHGLLRQPTQLK
jgi:hypothetical protein